MQPIIIVKGEGNRTAKQRLDDYYMRLRYRYNTDTSPAMLIYCPSGRKSRRLSSEALNGALAVTLYSLIALAVFASWSGQ